MLEHFESGAVRSSIDVRFDLLPPKAIRRLAKVLHEGAQKYGDRNWEKGIPMSNLLNHALNHIFLYMEGDTSEDHLGHAFWNLMAAVHFDELERERRKKEEKDDPCNTGGECFSSR